MRNLICVLAMLLSGCVTTSIEQSFRECLLLDRDATYTVSSGISKMECRR